MFWLGLENDVLDLALKAQSKKKMDKLDFIKM